MKQCIRFLLMPIMTLVLEILPFGAVCNFANPDGKPFRETFSYFSLVPFGYANFFPLLAGIFTVFAFVAVIIYLLSKKRYSLIWAEFLTWICFGFSLCPLLYGISFYSVTGLLITLTLFIEAILIHTALSKKEK